MVLHSDLIHASNEMNLNKLRQIFSDNESLVIRSLMNKNGSLLASFVYLNILVDEKYLNQHLVRKLNEDLYIKTGPANELALNTLNSLGTVIELKHIEAVVSLITDAGIAVMVEGSCVAYGILMPGYETRAIEEPKIEINVRGPKESFTEDLQQNLSMVHRKLKTPDLKSISYVIGQQSQTKVMLLYLENRIDPTLLAEIRNKIESIQLDVLIVNAQIEELIQDNIFTPFPQIFSTERPDRIATALGRGKAAIITDGTPIALIAPTSFFEMLHPSEDLYERFYFANFLRVLRLICLFISLFGPALYISLTTFHLEMIPTPLMMAFISSKAGIPFPTFIEAILMETAFEILREASLRLPRAVGQSVSIVGALIIGEAAVQSGIVSRPMVIVVAMTGIASFAIPSFSTAIALRMLRFPFILIAASYGVFGLSLSMFILIMHLCSLQTFGVPFLEPVSFNSIRDTLMKYILLPVKYRENVMQVKAGRADAPQRKKGGFLHRNDEDEYR
ncbi:hypothetical protein FHS16_003770 [Paenibacillus endophyticus]|uniref:Spore germination protein n=1 Tax=Paenibacillus endophyticus TaxID=1294268 RepID=A0A7W5C9P8_9BACL|nr:spore germination protein [Paenibacillus endophyticus]MBB3153695.1 hypothetical protein [Paenibacillus endophyticus]